MEFTLVVNRNLFSLVDEFLDFIRAKGHFVYIVGVFESADIFTFVISVVPFNSVKCSGG